MEGHTGWLHGMVRDLKTDAFSRRASIGSRYSLFPNKKLISAKARKSVFSDWFSLQHILSFNLKAS